VRATKDQIGARVDALAQAHEGDEFVTAVRHLADELGPEGQPVLQEVLLDRAAEEEHFKKALRQRNRGWTRRTLAKLEGLLRDDRADAVAEAVEAGSDGEEVLRPSWTCSGRIGGARQSSSTRCPVTEAAGCGPRSRERPRMSWATEAIGSSSP